MGMTIGYVMERAIVTRDAQALVQGTWHWEQRTLDEWAMDIRVVNRQIRLKSTREGELARKRALLDAALADLHDRTVQGLALARVRFRSDAVKLGVLQGLSADGTTREEILEQALEWEAAWRRLEPSWSPTPDNTLELLKALRIYSRTMAVLSPELGGQARGQSARGGPR